MPYTLVITDDFLFTNLTAISKYPTKKTLVGSVQASGIHTLNTIEIQATAEDFAFERLLTADEAIKLIPIHPNTLLLWARQRKIPSIPVGRRVFFRASDLNRWLEPSCYAGHAVLTASTERKAT
jgi:excisionase family DNA binding protein